MILPPLPSFLTSCRRRERQKIGSCGKMEAPSSSFFPLQQNRPFSSTSTFKWATSCPGQVGPIYRGRLIFFLGGALVWRNEGRRREAGFDRIVLSDRPTWERRQGFPYCWIMSTQKGGGTRSPVSSASRDAQNGSMTTTTTTTPVCGQRKKGRRVGLPRYHRDLIATINNAAASLHCPSSGRRKGGPPEFCLFILPTAARGPEWEGVLCRREKEFFAKRQNKKQHSRLLGEREKRFCFFSFDERWNLPSEVKLLLLLWLFGGDREKSSLTGLFSSSSFFLGLERCWSHSMGANTEETREEEKKPGMDFTNEKDFFGKQNATFHRQMIQNLQTICCLNKHCWIPPRRGDGGKEKIAEAEEGEERWLFDGWLGEGTKSLYSWAKRKEREKRQEEKIAFCGAKQVVHRSGQTNRARSKPDGYTERGRAHSVHNTALRLNWRPINRGILFCLSRVCCMGFKAPFSAYRRGGCFMARSPVQTESPLYKRGRMGDVGCTLGQ